MKFKNIPELYLIILICGVYFARFIFINTNIQTISFLHVTLLKLVCIILSVIIYTFLCFKILIEIFRDKQYIMSFLERIFYAPLRQLGLFVLALPSMIRDLILFNFKNINYLYQIHFIIFMYFMLPRVWFACLLYYDVFILHCMLLTSTLIIYTALPRISQGFFSFDSALHF